MVHQARAALESLEHPFQIIQPQSEIDGGKTAWLLRAFAIRSCNILGLCYEATLTILEGFLINQ